MADCPRSPQQLSRTDGAATQPSRSGDNAHVADDVQDGPCLTIQNDDMWSDSAATASLGQPRESHLELRRERLYSLLKAGRQSAVALQVFLESGR